MSATESEEFQGAYGEGSDYSDYKDLNKPFSYTIWTDGPNFTYQSSGEWHVSFGSEESLQGENEFPYFYYGAREEREAVGEEERVEEEEEYETYGKGWKWGEKKQSDIFTKSKSLFVHSFPSQFPDVTKARKSAFGSIFLKTSGEAEERALLRSIADNSYLLMSSLLFSLEKIIADTGTDPEKRRFTNYFRESLEKTLEAHGIRKVYSDGSVHWDIYPITQRHLFSLHLKDKLHQTRDLSKVEERIVMGPVKELRLPFTWPTQSIWYGYWDALGMSSTGIYNMPHGVSYSGKMQDGMFHDTNATLTYPNKFKALHCVFEKGKLLSCQFQFPDLLVYEDDWKYCKFPDRRFWSEVQNGLESAKIAQKTPVHPPRTIPKGCYDTGDGFYNPKSLMLQSPSGQLLRVPVHEEDLWIKKYCRKGFFEFANFRPDLFENWFNYDQDLINSILKQQSEFRRGKITYDELQQFYADLDLLPSFSPYKKRKTLAEIELEEFKKSIPEPKFLKTKYLKKFEGHKISEVYKTSKSDSKESEKLMEIISGRSEKLGISKISFSSSKHKGNLSDTSSFTGRKKIPEKYLKYQPLFKLPTEIRPRQKEAKKCIPRVSSTTSSSEIVMPDEGNENIFREIEQKNLKKFMKSIIMEKIMEILIEERKRNRRRYVWGRKFPTKEGKEESESLKVLMQLFDSIPDKDEYCDSDPKKTCDFKEFAKDKHNMLKYWGKRILQLDFDKKPRDEEKPKFQKLSLTINSGGELLFTKFLKNNL